MTLTQLSGARPATTAKCPVMTMRVVLGLAPVQWESRLRDVGDVGGHQLPGTVSVGVDVQESKVVLEDVFSPGTLEPGSSSDDPI